jgi:hypothetical protein
LPDANGQADVNLLELEHVAALVRVAAPPVEPQPGLERRVLAAVELHARAREAPPPRRRRRALPLALAGAGATAAAVLALVLPSGSDPLELRTVLRAPSAPASANVEVRRTGIGRVVDFRSDSLPILPKGRYYELWFVGPGDAPGHPNRISAGTFHPDEHGRSHVRFAAAVDPAQYPVLAVTAEPGDGDPRANGVEVLRD